MKTGLNVGERLIVCSILPKEGNVVTIRSIRELISRLGLTPEEIKEYEVVEKDGMCMWNVKGNEPKEFEFHDVELAMIRKQLRDLDAMSKLHMEQMPVYEKFCT